MKASISMKRASKAAKLRTKMREEIVVVYTAQRAGRDDAPKHDATSEGDRNNTSQQHVGNSQPVRDIAANAEFQRNRTDNHDDPMVVAEPRPTGAGMSGKAFESELAAMYTAPETPAEKLQRETQSRNKLWSTK